MYQIDELKFIVKFLNSIQRGLNELNIINDFKNVVSYLQELMIKNSGR